MEYKVSKIKLSPETALYKIKNWCAYQERSHYETRLKLFNYGLFSEDVENIIVQLIAENFLNEERFAIALASGKFRIKHWGKNKIKIELKKHKVSDYCINKALKSIDPIEYEVILQKVIQKKLQLIKKVSGPKQFYSVLNYVVSRGFESDLVSVHLAKMQKDNLK